MQSLFRTHFSCLALMLNFDTFLTFRKGFEKNVTKHASKKNTLFCYEKSQDASFQRSLSVLCSTAARTSPTSSLKKLLCCLSWLSKNHVLRLLPCFYTQKQTSFNRKNMENVAFLLMFMLFIYVSLYVGCMYVYLLLTRRYALNPVSPT